MRNTPKHKLPYASHCLNPKNTMHVIIPTIMQGNPATDVYVMANLPYENPDPKNDIFASAMSTADAPHMYHYTVHTSQNGTVDFVRPISPDKIRIIVLLGDNKAFMLSHKPEATPKQELQAQ